MPADCMNDTTQLDMAANPGPVTEPPRIGGLQKMLAIWNGRRARRLASDIATYRGELPFRMGESEASKIRSVLTVADAALEKHDIDSAWKSFNSACRLEFLLLKKPLDIPVQTILAEADKKLSGWRQTAVKKLLEGAPSNDLGERMFLASRIRDEYYDNQAYKDSLRRISAARFAILLLLCMVILWALSLWKHIPPDPPDSDQPITLLSVALFGLMGATISAIISAAKPQAASRIPELASSAEVTTLRLFMGPTCAIILYFVTLSPLVKELFNFALNNATILPLALAAGFSERLVLKVVDVVAGKDQTVGSGAQT